MANFDMVLKCWGPVDPDNKHGGLVLSRSVDNIGLYFALAQGVTFFLLTLSISARWNAAEAAHGATVLMKLGELLKVTTLPSLSPWQPPTPPIKHQHLLLLITEIICKVMGEEAGREALRQVMGVIIADIDVTYKELGFAG
uniref:Uncharacterized protein n=1 Tax=Oncorhynchus tshawytscha TaxID=74940 RepID=A0A8C8IJQ6_ONCTS